MRWGIAMNFLKNLRLSAKLPLVIVGLALMLTIITTSLTANLAGTAFHNEAENKLQGIVKAKAHELEAYLHSIERDLTVQAEHPYTVEALKAFEAAYADLGMMADIELQKIYIEKNPNPVGKKDMLNDGGTGSNYDVAHAKYHPLYHKLQQTNGYYDVFLFNMKGDLVYTVFKELDFATNMNTGQWKETDLANAFRAGTKLGAGEISFFDFRPYAPSYGAPASFMSTPVIENGKTIGVMVYQMPIDAINEVMNSKAGLGNTGETLLVGADYLVRNDSTFTDDNDILITKIEHPSVSKALAGEASNAENVETAHRGTKQELQAEPFVYAGTQMAIVALLDMAEIKAPIQTLLNKITLAAVAALVLIGGVGFMFARSITKPLSKITKQMNMLAEQNLDFELCQRDRKDEIGDMNRTMAVFKRNVLERRQLRENAERETAARIERAKQVEQRIARFRVEVGQIADELLRNADNMGQTADGLSSVAEDASEQASSASRASEEASTNVQTVASAADQLTSSIQEINRQITQSAGLIEKTSTISNNANSKVKTLDQAAMKIGEVVTLIQDIAEQTNLLALNATIEAARAGEAGKGFAVVATEVKALAEQTAKATGEISAQINGIQGSTKETVDAIEAISSMMNDVKQFSSAIAAAVEEQGAATQEISRNVGEAAAGTQMVAENVNNMSRTVEITAQSADDVRDVATAVQERTKHLDGVIDAFIDDVSAA
jgi:methyl-accepting chemotaxis protein